MNQHIDCLLQFRFIFRVHTCSCLIQDNDRRVFQHGSCNGNPLFFAAGKSSTTFSENRIITLRKGHDKIVTAGSFCGFHHFLMGGILFSEADVIFDGVIKKIYILEYHGNIFHQAVQLVFLYIVAAYQDLSALYIPESGDQIAERSFSAAGRSYYRSGASCRDLDGNAIQDLTVTIRETYVFKFHRCIFRTDFTAVGIHRRCVINRICFPHGFPKHLQIVGHISCIFQLLIYHKGSDQHQDTSGKIQASTVIKYKTCHCQRRAKYLCSYLSDTDPRCHRSCQSQRFFAAVIHCPGCCLIVIFFQTIGFYHAHALHIFQNRFYQSFLRLLSSRACFCGCCRGAFCYCKVNQNTNNSDHSKTHIDHKQRQTESQSI